MHTPARSSAETRRLAALSALEILDTAPEDRFDHITGLARRILGVPMAAITFVDAHHQWGKSGVGIASGFQIPRQEFFCQYTIGHDTTTVVTDTLTDARFHDIPLVTEEPRIRFYAAHPLHAPTGERVGSLCIIDIMARGFTTEQCQVLAGLAGLVEQELARTPDAHEPATTHRGVHRPGGPPIDRSPASGATTGIVRVCPMPWRSPPPGPWPRATPMTPPLSR